MQLLPIGGSVQFHKPHESAQAILKAYLNQAVRVTGPLGLFSSLKSVGGAKVSKSASVVKGKSAAERQNSGKDLTSFPPMFIDAIPNAIRLLMLTENCSARI